MVMICWGTGPARSKEKKKRRKRGEEKEEKKKGEEKEEKKKRRKGMRIEIQKEGVDSEGQRGIFRLLGLK